MTLKELREKRELLLNELEEMVSNISKEEEVRELTEEEKTAFKEKETEIKNIDSTIKVIEETRALAVGKEEVKKLNEERSKDECERRALENFFRGSDLSVEERTMLTTTSSNTATIPMTIAPTVLQKLEEMCPVLNFARRFNSKGTLRLLREDSYGEAGLTPEAQTFKEEDVLFGSVQLASYKVTAQVSVTFEMLQNSSIDLSNYLLDVIVRRLSKEINKLCMVGTGLNQAEGLVNGKNTFTLSSKLDITDLIKMQTAINPQYISGAKWICNRKTFQGFASLLDGTGRPYLTSNVIGEQIQYTFLGIPVVVDENMADLGNGNKAIILANIGECYAINMVQDITVRQLSEVGFVNGIQTYAGLAMFDGRIINNDAMIVGVCSGAPASAGK